MTLSKSAQAVQLALNAKGFSYQVQELESTTRTAHDAANALGCEITQIVKSLLFRTHAEEPILTLVSGSNRVDEQKLAALVNSKVVKADADFTRKVTGFAIGGIPPLGLKHLKHIFIDADLMQFTTCWAAAGTPHAVFKLNTDDLMQLSGGKIVDIKLS